MVQQSNNDSWALILAAVGHKGLTNYAASMGIPYDRTVNGLTPAEMAKTLSELYSGRLLNAGNTAQLLSYMQNTNYEMLIPAAAPPGVSVFHKYGLLNGNLHDASILVQGDRAFVFVVYTLGRDMSDMAARTRVIHAAHRHGRRRTLLTKRTFTKGPFPKEAQNRRLEKGGECHEGSTGRPHHHPWHHGRVIGPARGNPGGQGR